MHREHTTENLTENETFKIYKAIKQLYDYQDFCGREYCMWKISQATLDQRNLEIQESLTVFMKYLIMGDQ